MVLLKFYQTLTDKVGVGPLVEILFICELLKQLLGLSHHLQMRLCELFALIYLKHHSVLDSFRNLLLVRGVRFFDAVSQHVNVLRGQIIQDL